MPISGLAITLTGDAARAEDAQRALAADRRITLGCRHGNKLAVTVETGSHEEDRRLRDWVGALPGVTFIDIAFIYFADDDCPAAIAASTDPHAMRSAR